MPPPSPARIFQPATLPFVCRQCRLRIRTSRQAFRSLSQTSKQYNLATAQDEVVESPTKPGNGSTFKRVRKPARQREPRLPEGPARTRFAPSPTGYLHIGGLRTALFSYLLAKRTGGQFLLRIEDTDQKRLVPDAESRLLEDLRWAGLQWDEGPEIGGPHGPYRQSERTLIYQDHARQLFEQSSAYVCFCTPQSADGGQSTSYVTSGCYQNCASLSREEAQRRVEGEERLYTVRLRTPLDAETRLYPDLVYGNIKRLKRSPAPQASASSEDGGNADLDGADTILMKSDGTPTYHFANVVDDHLMGITHVIRGAEWMASTPLHYDIYTAFGWQPPQFAHVGLLVDKERRKLSKRSADLAYDVAGIRKQHSIPPQTLNNFLALLGWSNPTRNDVMDTQALISNFDMKFTRGNAVVTMEKLGYLHQAHMRNLLHLSRQNQDLSLITDLLPALVDKVRQTYPDPVCNGRTTLEANPDILSDRLSAYCADILITDDYGYRGPLEFLQRCWSFFHWRPEEVPEAEEVLYTTDGQHGIPVEVLRDSVKDFVDKFTWEASESKPPDTKPSTHPQNLALQHLRHDLYSGWHELGCNLTLTLSLPPKQSENVDCAVPEDIDLGIFPLSKEVARQLVDRCNEERSSDSPEGHAQTLMDMCVDHKIQGATGRPPFELPPSIDLLALRTTMEKRRSIVRHLLDKYMRLRLRYGQSGMSTEGALAVLGESECRRRLC